MMTTVIDATDVPVRKTITVKASADRAFKVFTEGFDTIFVAERIHVIHTPVRAPNANAFAERWLKTVRNECLDKLLIFDESHSRRVMHDYTAYYNTPRPHQGLARRTLIPIVKSTTDGPVRCRSILGGIQHDYYRDAA